MKRKRILQISTGILRYDGLSEVLLSLIDHAPKDKCEISVLLGKGAIPEFYEILKKRNISYYEGPDRELDVRNYVSYLYRLLKKENFDIVHIHGNSATMAVDLFVAKICGVKTRIAHSHNTVTRHPVIHEILKPLLGTVVTQPAACGKDAGEFLFCKDFVVIPNCIDISRFAYDSEIRRQWRQKLKCSDKFLIGHVGRFTYQKNHKLLIDIFHEVQKHIPNAVLLLIGDGELVDDVKKQIGEYGIADKVILYGTSDHVSELMQAMDLFLLPSNYEGLSVTALEAQATGLPCIMTNTISEETRKSGECCFVDIDAPLEEWSEIIEKYSKSAIDREKGSVEVRDAGHDVDELGQVICRVWNLSGKE